MGSATRYAAAAALCAIGWHLGAGVACADPAVPSPPPSPTPSPVPPGPKTTLDAPGTYAVGTQIQPGVYTSAGPLPGTVCYWRRIGADDTTVDNAMSKQPQVVAIDPTDAAFKTNGCQPWQLSQDAAPPGPPPPLLSQLQLRHELDVLNGLAGQSGNGQLPPY